jgi:hypothetical protein
LCSTGKLNLKYIDDKSPYEKCRKCKYDGENVYEFKLQWLINIQEHIFLNVKFEEKNEIKKLGGSFDFNSKKWFVSKDNKNLKMILKKWTEYIPK